MQRIHHLRVCANTTEQIINGNTSCITSQSPSERWASIRMQYIWVCVLTHTCVPTHTYTRVQLSCICDKKRQLQYHHQLKICGRLVGRRSPTRGRCTDFFISTVVHGDHYLYLTYPIGNKVLTADLLQRTLTG